MGGVEFGLFLMLLLGVVVPVGVIIIVVAILWRSQRSAEQRVRSPEYWEQQWAESDSLLRDLDRRLAEGEIDRSEYERLRERYRH
ncbi:hypothetical protein NI17_021105 [Thermobifida halotolerans]|uniref:Uncharacterized protein n=1 Tax=Thermobifida halotolerans TaxID=483545 RepID=A0A399FXX2_9ACTN|nr:hypothetical protein [Thermobifida halotolerans]UOE19216.1 hypothetical protein NI17_021105 [Thermobifida halotolerans]